MEWSRHPITGMVGNWALRTRSRVGALQQSRPGRPGGQIHIAAIKVKTVQKKRKAHVMQLILKYLLDH